MTTETKRALGVEGGRPPGSETKSPSKKLIRYNYLVSAVVPSTGRFTTTIAIPFEPDEVKIKQVAYRVSGTANTLFYLRCPTMTEKATDPFGILTDPTVGYPALTHRLGRNINGEHQFELYEYTGALTARTGNLMIQLEFRKWV